jgi:hypothetical protein
MRTEAEFWARVDRAAECWIWTGSLNTGGYGTVSWRGQPVVARRLAWCLTYGEWPVGLLRRSRRCRPECVRPEHMADDAEQHREMDLATESGRPVCSIGHPHELRWLRDRWVCAICVREQRQARKLGHLWDPPEDLSWQNSGRTMPARTR